MIRRRTGFYQLLVDVVPRVELAHLDLTNIVQWLRDPAVEIYTTFPVPPAEDGVLRFQIHGFRKHFAGELARFAEYRSDADTALARQRFSEVDAALADYLEALPRVVAAFDLLLSRYPNAATVQTAITNAHRRALSDAIVAELQG